MTASFEQFQAELNRLVARFAEGFKDFSAADYSEARLRLDSLDPFLRSESREHLVCETKKTHEELENCGGQGSK